MSTGSHGERKKTRASNNNITTHYFVCAMYKRIEHSLFSSDGISGALGLTIFKLRCRECEIKSIIDNKKACKNTNSCLDLAHRQHRNMFWIEIYKWASSTWATIFSLLFCFSSWVSPSCSAAAFAQLCFRFSLELLKHRGVGIADFKHLT